MKGIRLLFRRNSSRPPSLDALLLQQLDRQQETVLPLEDEILRMPSPVAVVGNGPLLPGFGELIDAHPTVVRFNGFRVAGYEDRCGGKTNYWCFNGGPFPEPQLPKSVPAISPTSFSTCFLYAANFHGRQVYCLQDHRLYGQVARLGGIAKPTTGFRLVSLLSWFGKSVSVFGFDGLRTGHYWNPGHVHVAKHNYESESGSELDALSEKPGVTLYFAEKSLGFVPSNLTGSEVLEKTARRPTFLGSTSSLSTVASTEQILLEMPTPIAVVGNALSSSKSGRLIDYYPTVIRFNNFKDQLDPTFYGSKITHWGVTGFGNLARMEHLCRLRLLGRIQENALKSVKKSSFFHFEEVVPSANTGTTPTFIPLGLSSESHAYPDPNLQISRRPAFVRDWVRFSLPILGITPAPSAEFATICMLRLLGRPVSVFSFHGWGPIETVPWPSEAGRLLSEKDLLRSSAEISLFS